MRIVPHINGKYSAVKALVFLVLVFMLSVSCFALENELECVLTEENTGNGYKYTVYPIGSFTVNAEEGEEVSAAVFSMDPQCRAELYKDGEKVPFDGKIIIEPGNYQMRIYPLNSNGGPYGSFRFSVKNDFSQSAIGGNNDFSMVEDPPLKVKFDSNTGNFRYILPNERYFDSNVPLGGFTRENVKLEVPFPLNVQRVYYNHKTFDYKGELKFHKPGIYEIIISDNELGMDGDTGYTVRMSFNILSQEEISLSLINAPGGLYIKNVTCDGKNVKTGEDYAYLKEDGKYLIQFADSSGQTVNTFEFTRDTTPPALEFDRKIEKNIKARELNFKKISPDDKIVIRRNYDEVYASLNKIAVPGRYNIEVTDSAGNVREYNFYLDTGLNVNFKIMFIIPLIILSAAALFLYYHWHRHPEVL